MFFISHPPPPPSHGLSADVIWGENMKRGMRNRGIFEAKREKEEDHKIMIKGQNKPKWAKTKHKGE
jgi:hypothetical protein